MPMFGGVTISEQVLNDITKEIQKRLSKDAEPVCDVKPLPCSICGKKELSLRADRPLDDGGNFGEATSFWVGCDEPRCQVTGPSRSTEESAILAWNELNGNAEDCE